MTSTSKSYLVLLEDAILALIGVSAGLTASLELSICCVHFRDALASPVMDEQLFGRLYAATAGVDDPGHGLLHARLPRQDRTGRNDLGNTPLKSYSPSIEEVVRKRDRHCGDCFPSAQTASEGTHTLPGGVGVSTVPPGFLSWETSISCELVRTSSDSTKGGRRSCASPKVGFSRKQPPCLPTRSEITTWKSRFKANLATRMRPTEFFSFPAQRMGSQDVLMSVVPSIPPTIAVTCTTELSLFALDGTRINPTARSAQTNCTSGTDQMVPSDHPRAMVGEAHDRDIRCLAVSTAGDRVATGSLDCTILVRSVSNCPWVRRLRGHRAGIRCLVFHGTRLVSADSLGVMSVWDMFPDTRRLHTIQGHSDSVQVLTRTGGGEFVASGALDGRVAVWSVSTEGTLSPVSRYDGFGHPYRLASVGRSLVFTSSSAPSIQVDGYNGANRPYGGSGRHAYDDHMPSSASTGSYVSIVGVSGDFGMRVSTGQTRVHHLVAGLCIGAVMVSPAEPWGCETDYSSGEDEADMTTQNSGHVDSKPRICRFRVVRVRRGVVGENSNWNLEGNRAGSHYHVAFASEWVTLSQDPVRMSPNMWKGNCDEDGGESYKDGEDFEGGTGALATCAVFVGTTVFLGYDTGCVWAHRVTDGRRLYRLHTSGPLVHLVEADGSLYSYDSTGTISIWMWGGKR